ncbi:hypothetical protein PG993_000310 [Apiospora rasikravindrae]|uniref:Uncharacterized protein n=1 Tax=Apiospora rasikravindrae TaxID=990691 RepID=A0ABR1UAY6_9PEZI
MATLFGIYHLTEPPRPRSSATPPSQPASAARNRAGLASGKRKSSKSTSRTNMQADRQDAREVRVQRFRAALDNIRNPEAAVVTPEQQQEEEDQDKEGEERRSRNPCS